MLRTAFAAVQSAVVHEVGELVGEIEADAETAKSEGDPLKKQQARSLTHTPTKRPLCSDACKIDGPLM